MTHNSWLMLGMGLVLVGCGADPEADLVGQDEVLAVEPEEQTADEADEADEAAEPTDSVEPDEGPGPDDMLAPPAQVSAPIGVVYEATGALNETFGLIQTPDVSVFSNAEVTAYVDAETITVCPTNDGCTRGRREGLELMGMLGGQLVTDMTAFAASVPFSSSSTETIAGRDAGCIVPDDDELLQEYCYDLLSGIALRWRVIDEGVPTSVTAIEVFEPTPADLTPTGPVEDRADGDRPDTGDLNLEDLNLEDLNLEDLDLDDLPGA